MTPWPLQQLPPPGSALTYLDDGLLAVTWNKCVSPQAAFGTGAYYNNTKLTKINPLILTFYDVILD